MTSGTTSRCAKAYEYSLPEYLDLERYHFEKICYLNDINKESLIVWIRPQYFFEGRSVNFSERSAVPSLNDNVYIVSVPFDANHNEWLTTYRSILDLSPGLVYTTPASFLAASFVLQSCYPIFDCPIMFTGETLFDNTRERALDFFPVVIDKMRCWDTGLSFIECKYGTRHIDDELCLAVENNGQIISTDFFNYAASTIAQITDDIGTIQISECRCGIYGRIFTSFIGKSMQCLWTKDGTPCDPHTISGLINSFLKTKNEPHVPYLIRQDKEGAVTLFACQKNESILTVKNVLDGVLRQPVQIAQYDEAPKNNKLFLMTSEFAPML
jgi:hypothetical protein